uniref:NADH-ubiquinone oxidoreductase chain 3 n=1 Tax=Notocrater youngi TaxID=2813390 RepID=A0A894K923_9VEST|nr:NADH dehydrogenase subunit 3 [Notocrater youngi]
MLLPLLSSIIAIIIAFAVSCIAWTLAKRTFSDREKMSPFECGFDPVGSARLPFSMRFFLLAVIFLVFDVEVVLLFPVVVDVSTGLTPPTLIGTMMFLIILLIGLFHEWREGSLNWN